MDGPLPPMWEVGVFGGQETALQALRRSQFYKRPKFVIPILLWVFGLFAMFFCPPPHRITPQMQAEFDAKIQEAQYLNKVCPHCMAPWFDAFVLLLGL